MVNGVEPGSFAVVLSRFGDIGTRLDAMIDRKQLDMSILQPLDELARFARSKEELWKTYKGVSPKSAFVVYHSWRNIRLIFDKIQNRFLEASKRHENPLVAVDTSKVLASLVDAYTGVTEVEGRELAKDEQFATLNRITELRNVAYSCNMLPSIDDELKETDRKNIVEEFDNFAIAVRASEETTEDSARD